MSRVKFVVPGKPIGYIATTHRGKWTSEYQKFANYAKEVRAQARAAGISIPLVATKEQPLIIRTIAYFANGNHCDPGNVQKGVVDALFYDEERAAIAKLNRKLGRKKKGKGTGKGDDKHTGGSFAPPLYDKLNPRVVVIIKRYEPEQRKKADEQTEERSRKKRSKKAQKATRRERQETRAEEPRKSDQGCKKNVRTRRTRRKNSDSI